MATITPTFSSLRWGPEMWQVFDYTAHPVRDPNGNPCLIFRHAGGGHGGYLVDVWGGTSVYNKFFTYLLDPSRDVHFDIISVETAQQIITNGTPPPTSIPRSKMVLLLDSVFDFQRAVCAIKRWGAGVNNGTTYYINPDKVITGGHSHGATLAGLASLMNPIVNTGAMRTMFRRRNEPVSYDSKGLGVFLFAPQVDIRRRMLTDGGGTSVRLYMAPSNLPAWTGTPGTISSPTWTSLVPDYLKEAMSILAYIDQGATDNYVPMFTLFGNDVGAHTYPLSDPHDKVQRDDLNAALTVAGLQFQTDQVFAGAGPTFYEMDSANSFRAYSWMSTLVRGAKKYTGVSVGRVGAAR